MWAVAAAFGLVLASVAILGTGRVVEAQEVESSSPTALVETAAAGFTFDTREFVNLTLGATISVTFFDSDVLPHTFTLINDPGVQIPTTDSPSQLDAIITAHGTLFSVNASQATYNNTTFTAPSTAGWYEFVCEEVGHFQAGMYGFVSFGEALPQNVSFTSGSPAPGIAVFIIIGTIVALTVLAIVLGFVVGQRHGSEHEMPPERLGYPEPRQPTPVPVEPPSGPHPPYG